MNTTVERVSDFVDSIGVNTRLAYTDGDYADISTVIKDIQYLGLSNVRDTITDGLNGSAFLASYIALAEAGIKFTIEPFSGGTITDADVAAQLTLIAALETAVPGSVIAVEGANEVNNFSLTFDGVSGLAGAVALQQVLYAAVKADPLLSGVSVDYFTGYDAGTIGQGPDPLTTTGLADYDTQHPYPNNGDAPYLAVTPTIALGNEPDGTGPVVYTETGYSTMPGVTGYVSEDVQAKYTLDLLMDDARNGVAETYLYQLLDAYAPGSAQGDTGFGLFDYTGAAKPVAVAIHNLTTILADNGSDAASFAPKALDYTLTGLPATGNSLDLQKSDGTTDIVVWAEPAIWNEATETEITAATETVTVDLGAVYQTVEVFDPLLSASPIETLTDVSSVALGISDHPLIVEVEGDQLACFAAGTYLRMERGERPVEQLAVGDRVMTAKGDLRRIAWVGSRHVDCLRHPAPEQVLPVRVRAEAFGDGLPEHDLWLSPDHAVFMEGVLIPVKYLINGLNITQQTVDAVTYYHVALADHDILLAEGLPVESYLESRDRLAFGQGVVVALHPAWGAVVSDSALAADGLAYAPIRVHGPEVAAVRAMVEARAERLSVTRQRTAAM